MGLGYYQQLMGAALPARAIKYIQRVESDGGFVVDKEAVGRAFVFLENEAFYVPLRHLSSYRAGIKLDASGKVQRLYSLDPLNNDATEIELAKRPTFVDGHIVYDGASSRMLLNQNAVAEEKAGSTFLRWSAKTHGNMQVASSTSGATYIYNSSSTKIRTQGDNSGMKEFVFPTIALNTEHRLWQVRKPGALAEDIGLTSLFLDGAESSSGPQPVPHPQSINSLGQYRGVVSGDLTYSWDGALDTVGIWGATMADAQRVLFESTGL